MRTILLLVLLAFVPGHSFRACLPVSEFCVVMPEVQPSLLLRGVALAGGTLCIGKAVVSDIVMAFKEHDKTEVLGFGGAAKKDDYVTTKRSAAKPAARRYTARKAWSADLLDSVAQME